MDDFTFYTFCDRDYFEPLSRWRVSATYADRVRALVPQDWQLASSDVWFAATPPGARLRPQGFKIHVSSRLADADAVLRAVVPECARTSTAFKVVGDPTLHGYMNSKRCTRAGAGKFMTIYPKNDELFAQLLETLHRATAGLEGPYILSDRRYRDSKVLSYRYGGFQKIEDIVIDGTRRHLIYAPDGTLVPDMRVPYFHLPDWVTDPFPETAEDPADDLLNGRYRVEEALTISNTGGIYRAIDSTINQSVILKEARPHTLCWSGTREPVDALGALRHEQAVLERLDGVPGVPGLIEQFQEWEHTFLVVSYFDGLSLRRLRAVDTFMVLGRMHESARVSQFTREWCTLAGRLLDIVQAIHARGVIVGDISPGNVLLHRATSKVAIIDFEGARLMNESEDAAPLGRKWFNPGFRKPDRPGWELSAFDDFYSCGMTLYNLLCPFQTLFDLDKTQPVFRMLDYFVEAGLPSCLREVIRALLDGDAETARRLAADGASTAAAAGAVSAEDATTENAPSAPSVLGSDATPGHLASGQAAGSIVAALPDDAALRETMMSLGQHMVATIELGRTDRLWPADAMVFQTNPLNLAYGACGTALFLHDLLGELPPGVREWLLARPVELRAYAPGLYSGIAGVAWSFAEMGMVEQGAELLRLVPKSPLAFESPDMLNGAAGWGLASLAMHLRTSDQTWLDLACQAAGHIAAKAEHDARGAFWHAEDGTVRLGFGLGGSGIGLFLLSLWRVTQEPRHLALAREALEFDLAHAQKHGDTYLWGRTTDDVGHSPYWLRGGGGVATALIRFAQVLDDARYRELARKAARGCEDFSAAPHAFEGLAAMGETMLDMFMGTGDPRYLTAAREKASQVLLYRIDRPQGLAFPGRFLLRISHDFALGGAGIGLFLHRLVHQRPRRFHDIFPDQTPSVVPARAHAETAGVRP